MKNWPKKSCASPAIAKCQSTKTPSWCGLLARMELGDSIPEELYRTIAEIIAFAWNLKGKFPEGQDPNAPMVEKDITDRGDDY
jgi:flagellar biosynthesis protein